jgi:16S rRNA U1498 N3-methylase RsmE
MQQPIGIKAVPEVDPPVSTKTLLASFPSQRAIQLLYTNAKLPHIRLFE